MEVERANAFTMYYEPFELEGKRLYGTGYAVDHDTVPDGFYYQVVVFFCETNVYVSGLRRSLP